jgi:hypothetical protein
VLAGAGFGAGARGAAVFIDPVGIWDGEAPGAVESGVAGAVGAEGFGFGFGLT